MPDRVLVVDDDKASRNRFLRTLETEGFEVEAVCDGREAMHCFRSYHFDLILSEVQTEHVSGIDLLNQVRSANPEIGFIFQTQHATVSMAITALRNGADDFLLKPLKNEELLASVRAGIITRNNRQRRNQLEVLATRMLGVMNLTEPSRIQHRRLVCGQLEIDVDAFQARLNGQDLTLTPTEFRLLKHLCNEPGVAFKYIELVQAACGYTCSRQEAREIIGTHVRNLRQKVGVEKDNPLYVSAVRGVGYRLIPAMNMS